MQQIASNNIKKWHHQIGSLLVSDNRIAATY